MGIMASIINGISLDNEDNVVCIAQFSDKFGFMFPVKVDFFHLVATLLILFVFFSFFGSVCDKNKNSRKQKFCDMILNKVLTNVSYNVLRNGSTHRPFYVAVPWNCFQ